MQTYQYYMKYGKEDSFQMKCELVCETSTDMLLD
jgi:hypothetical protein